MNDTNALTIPPALLSDADNGIGNGTEATPKDKYIPVTLHMYMYHVLCNV